MTVEPSCVAKYEVLTKLAKLAVDTRLERFTAVTLDTYPEVPRPMTVLVKLL